MLKKKIKYTDYNGVEREEEFYFNLTKAEITELETSVDGGLSKMLEKIIEEKDIKKIIEMFRKIILISYGEKSQDGKRFIKSQEIQDGFAQSEAYSELFMELATDPDAAVAFVNGITPQNSKPASN